MHVNYAQFWPGFVNRFYQYKSNVDTIDINLLATSEI